MKVYRPRSNWMDDDRLSVPSMTVHERDCGGRETGLLDSNGTPLMAFDEMNPIGFVTTFEVPRRKPRKRK